MQLLIPFAVPISDSGRQAAAALALPRLQALLSRLDETWRDTGEETSLSPPHERAQARALGLAGGSGLLPWAAYLAAADGVDVADLAWGLATPGHWHLGTEQVSLMDPEQLALDESASRELFQAVLPLFNGDGYLLRWGAPLRWYVAHESLAGLATASLDRVIGRNVDAWLGSDPAARRIRRLQSEVQMLLHTHPINGRRVAQGLLPVNSFWISGCGVAQSTARPEPVVDACLRSPALAEDWAAWVKAWDTLEEGPVAQMLAAVQRGTAVQLTLCGERAAATWSNASPGLWRRLNTWFRPPALWPLLESL